jgi:hypothetical protein
MKVAYLLACDYFAPDQNTGKITFVGVFDKITLLAPVSNRGLSVGGRFLDVPSGQHNIRIFLRKENAEEVGGVDVPLDLNGASSASFGVTFDVSLSEEGKYCLGVSKDGESLASEEDFFIEVVKKK